MSRARKTQARKQAKQEDREDAALFRLRMEEIGPDPDKWETVSLDELLERINEDDQNNDRHMPDLQTNHTDASAKDRPTDRT